MVPANRVRETAIRTYFAMLMSAFVYCTKGSDLQQGYSLLTSSGAATALAKQSICLWHIICYILSRHSANKDKDSIQQLMYNRLADYFHNTRELVNRCCNYFKPAQLPVPQALQARI